MEETFAVAAYHLFLAQVEPARLLTNRKKRKVRYAKIAEKRAKQVEMRDG